MSGAEVTESPVDVLMVKEEEPSDSHKTQVILHLQPILQGVNEDTAETGTTVLAIETHHEDDNMEGEEVEYGYPITCGDSRAVLLFKKFVCPGINVRCVKFNEQLISPKQFVHLAGKATLKDWKRAIRLGGVMLRKMMDSGQIDFYQHDTVCTNTCRSTKFDQLINSTRLPPGTIPQPAPSPSPMAVYPGDGGPAEEGSEEKASTITEWTSGAALPNNYTTANGHVKRKRADLSDGILRFWKDVADIGLMGEVLSSIRTELMDTLRGVEIRSDRASLLEADGQMLNSLCDMFGLLDSVRRALDLRLRKIEENQKQVHNTPFDMDEQTVLYETSSFRASSKRPRLHQITTSPTQTQSQSPILSPVTASPVGQPLSVAGLPVATLAQLPTGSQLFSQFSSTSAGRAGAGHSAPGGTLLSAPTEAGLGIAVQSATLEKEQQRLAMDDSQQSGQRTEHSHSRREEGREDKDRGEKVQRKGSCDVELLVVGEETQKRRKSK